MSKTDHQTCAHLLAFRSRHGTKPFRSLQDCLRVNPPGRAIISRAPNEIPKCSACSHAPSRLYACLSCACLSCHSHAPSHARDNNHSLAVDVDRAELFCCLCVDQIYDPDFDNAVVLALAAAATLGGGESIRIPPPENLRKRRRVDYRPWTPDVTESSLIEKKSILIQKSDLDLPMGLKGLNNLGNSCFMNSVLQALLHTAPLRNYFLSDRHNRYFCQQRNRDNKDNKSNNNKNPRLCLACEMDSMISAVYSGDRIPHSPAKFLYSWWQHAANLASYEQQDAHEFFISMLDGIHEKVESDKRRPHSQEFSVQVAELQYPRAGNP